MPIACFIITVTFIVLGLSTPAAQAQSPPPDFQVQVWSEQQSEIRISGFTYRPEITPLVGRQPDGRYYYLLPSAWTWKCLDARNPLSGDIYFNFNDCSLVSRSELLQTIDSEGRIQFIPQSTYDGLVGSDRLRDWKQSYDGILGHKIIGTAPNQRVVLVRHGEHQNVRAGDQLYQGQVFPQPPVEQCAAGYDSTGVYHHCWESFAQFISLGWADYDPKQGWSSTTPIHDEGPIIWPSKGYVQWMGGDGKYHAWNGFYEPDLFVDSGYLYLFFVNRNDLPVGRKYQCISAARAPESSLGLPGTWNNYRAGQFGTPSLPAGFDKNRIADFYGLDFPTIPADCLFTDQASRNSESISFQVAKVVGTDLYIGAEERAHCLIGDACVVGEDTGWQWQMGIRLSRDLKQWTPLKLLATAPGPFGAGWYAYPTFYNASGTDNYRIERGDFYILGKHATGKNYGYELSKMRLRLEIPGYPTSLNRAERLVRQYYREFLGWDIPVTDPGFRSHVSILEQAGCEADAMKFVESDVFRPTKQSVDNRRYVEILYRALVSRRPDGLPNGSEGWVAQLAKGALNRDNIVAAMFGAGETQRVCAVGQVLDAPPPLSRSEGLVRQYYREFLGWEMPVTDPGFRSHVSILEQAGCEADAMKFVDSDVFRQTKQTVHNRRYVEILYRALLSRQPDGLPNGSEAWVAHLASGTLNRDNIVAVMFDGWEPQNVCATGKLIQN